MFFQSGSDHFASPPTVDEGSCWLGVLFLSWECVFTVQLQHFLLVLQESQTDSDTVGSRQQFHFRLFLWAPVDGVGKRAVPSLWRPQALWSHSVAVRRDFGYRLETPNNTSSGHMVSLTSAGWPQPVHLVKASTLLHPPGPVLTPAHIQQQEGKSRTREQPTEASQGLSTEGAIRGFREARKSCFSRGWQGYRV